MSASGPERSIAFIFLSFLLSLLLPACESLGTASLFEHKTRHGLSRRPDASVSTYLVVRPPRHATCQQVTRLVPILDSQPRGSSRLQAAHTHCLRSPPSERLSPELEQVPCRKAQGAPSTGDPADVLVVLFFFFASEDVQGVCEASERT